MKQTMERLAVSRGTVYNLESKGKLKRIDDRLGIRKVLFLEEDINKILGD